MQALIEAIHCFTETGELWNAKTWGQKLNKSWSFIAVRNLLRFPEDHSCFTEDPQVNFSSLQTSCALTLDLPLSVKMVDLTAKISLPIRGLRSRVGRQQTLPRMNPRALCHQLLVLTRDFAILLHALQLCSIFLASINIVLP